MTRILALLALLTLAASPARGQEVLLPSITP